VQTRNLSNREFLRHHDTKLSTALEFRLFERLEDADDEAPDNEAILDRACSALGDALDVVETAEDFLEWLDELIEDLPPRLHQLAADALKERRKDLEANLDHARTDLAETRDELETL